MNTNQNNTAMEVEEVKTDSRSSSQQRFTVRPSTEKGFDIRDCFDENKEEFVYDKDYYFNSYSHFGIHEDMLKDNVRTMGYMNAITKNPHLFEGKIVLDVGAGTGILSIFAAWAGAKHVYAIENANIAKHAGDIIKENGLQDKITVIKSKVEEAELPVKQVDIIISEWMGYFLLYEAMLDTVLFARDKWLAKDGILLPDRATLFMASIEDSNYKEQKIGFWENVYGVSMTAIQKWAVFEPIVDCIEQEAINSNSYCIFDIDLKTVKVEDLDFSSEYRLSIRRQDCVHAVVFWFEVYFTHGSVPTKISTSPYMRPTHWKQVSMYLDDVLKVNRGDILYGSVAVKKAKKNPRELDIKISYHLSNTIHQNYSRSQYYKLS